MSDFQIKTFEKDNILTQTVEDNATNPILEQVNEFDNSYSDTKIKELTQEFDSITISEDAIASVTLTKNNAVEKEAVSFRAKLVLACTITITALLMFLCIYNIFRINYMTSNIQILESNIATESVILNSLQNDVTDLNNTANLESELANNGYYEISKDNIIYVETSDAVVLEEMSGSTNWFDAVCNFISNVFGG